MSQNAYVAIWGCIVCSTVWASRGSEFGFVAGMVWLVAAAAIYVVEKLKL